MYFLFCKYYRWMVKNYNEDLGFAEYIVSTGHLTPRASSVSSSSSPGLNGGNSSAFCAFTKFEDFMNRDCKIERKINTPKVTQGIYQSIYLMLVFHVMHSFCFICTPVSIY